MACFVDGKMGRGVCAGNKIGDEGAKTLSAALSSLSPLTQLNLDGMFCCFLFGA